MKKITLILTATCLALLASAQEINRNVKHFTRVIASPRVNVILSKGDYESVRLVYENVSAHKINVDVNGKTLRIFLDNARKFERAKPNTNEDGAKESMYAGVSVTAYVTYRELELLEIRGNQELSCKDAIVSDAFTLRAYGENDIRLSSLETSFFKAKLHGGNDVRIGKGRTLEQKYISYGENKVDAAGMRSDYIITSIFGEGSLKLNSAEEVRIDAFGEPDIHVDGGAHINRRLVIGNANIYQLHDN